MFDQPAGLPMIPELILVGCTPATDNDSDNPEAATAAPAMMAMTFRLFVMVCSTFALRGWSAPGSKDAPVFWRGPGV